jgi:hypothetical protein
MRFRSAEAQLRSCLPSFAKSPTRAHTSPRSLESKMSGDKGKSTAASNSNSWLGVAYAAGALAVTAAGLYVARSTLFGSSAESSSDSKKAPATAADGKGNAAASAAGARATPRGTARATPRGAAGSAAAVRFPRRDPRLTDALTPLKTHPLVYNDRCIEGDFHSLFNLFLIIFCVLRSDRNPPDRRGRRREEEGQEEGQEGGADSRAPALDSRRRAIRFAADCIFGIRIK